MLILDHLAEVVFVTFLYCEVTLPFFLYPCSLKKSLQTHMRWELRSTSLRAWYPHTLLEFFCKRNLSLLPLIYQVIFDISMNSWIFIFILCAIIQYHFVIQTVPTLAVESSFLLATFALWHISTCVYSSTWLPSVRCFNLVWAISQGALVPLLENGVRNCTPGLQVYHCHGVLASRFSQLAEQWVYVLEAIPVNNNPFYILSRLPW